MLVRIHENRRHGLLFGFKQPVKGADGHLGAGADVAHRNILRHLFIGQGKHRLLDLRAFFLMPQCPFVHRRSSFQYKFDTKNY